MTRSSASDVRLFVSPSEACAVSVWGCRFARHLSAPSRFTTVPKSRLDYEER